MASADESAPWTLTGERRGGPAFDGWVDDPRWQVWAAFRTFGLTAARNEASLAFRRPPFRASMTVTLRHHGERAMRKKRNTGLKRPEAGKAAKRGAGLTWRRFTSWRCATNGIVSCVAVRGGGLAVQAGQIRENYWGCRKNRAARKSSKAKGRRGLPLRPFLWVNVPAYCASASATLME